MTEYLGPSRGGWNRKSKSRDLRGQDFCKLAAFAGLFLEIWALLAKFAGISEGSRQVGYKKYFILTGLFCPDE